LNTALPQFCQKPSPYDPHYHYQLAVDARLIRLCRTAWYAGSRSRYVSGQMPTILKVNSANSLAGKDTIPDQAVTSSVADAVRLGCAAIGFTIYPVRITLLA